MPPFPQLFHLTPPTTTTKRRSPPPTRCLMNDLPNELILAVLHHLPLQDILTLTLIHHRSLNSLCLQVLATILSQPNRARLRFFFDQEYKWRSTIDMVLVPSSSNNFVFRPVHTDLSFRAYSSLVLRRPTLNRISIVDYINNTFVVENFLTRSLSVDIKHIQPSTVAIDGRVGAFLRYRVHATPPNRVKQRSGERWIQPIEFSCHPWWICQTKTYLLRLLQSIPCSAGLLRFDHHHHHHHYTATISKFLARSQNVPIVGHGMVLGPLSKEQPLGSSSCLGIAAPS